MTASIPEWVADTLGIGNVYVDENEMRGAIDASLAEKPFYAFSTDDFMHTVSARRYIEVEFLQPQSTNNWRFSEVYVGGNLECYVVEIGEYLTGAIPTSALRSLLLAWFLDSANGPKEIFGSHSGKILVGWFSDASARKVTPSLAAGVVGVELACSAVKVESLLRKSTRFDLATSSWTLKEKLVYGELLQSALRQTEPGLKFLCLYRLFERAYLSHALETFQSSFFSDPGRAIKLAESTVSNEKQLFISLVQGASAESFFEDIETIFSTNKTNKFLIGVYRSASEDGDLKVDVKWKRGCILAYKVRCAIVHSGKSGPIFESYPDSSHACFLLNEKLEAAAISFMQINGS